jgi:N,N-dimethylformamidase
MLPLAGYADRFSVAPGETIAFKVSSALAGTYQARLVRVISGDPNPAGPGIRERDVPAPFAGAIPRASSGCRSAPTRACRTRRRCRG